MMVKAQVVMIKMHTDENLHALEKPYGGCNVTTAPDRAGMVVRLAIFV
jgi:hypothetical protein